MGVRVFDWILNFYVRRARKKAVRDAVGDIVEETIAEQTRPNKVAFWVLFSFATLFTIGCYVFLFVPSFREAYSASVAMISFYVLGFIASIFITFANPHAVTIVRKAFLALLGLAILPIKLVNKIIWWILWLYIKILRWFVRLFVNSAK